VVADGGRGAWVGWVNGDPLETWVARMGCAGEQERTGQARRERGCVSNGSGATDAGGPERSRALRRHHGYLVSWMVRMP
jgi:hypothetical protein